MVTTLVWIADEGKLDTHRSMGWLSLHSPDDSGKMNSNGSIAKVTVDSEGEGKTGHHLPINGLADGL